jgi:hypothetical protein
MNSEVGNGYKSYWSPTEVANMCHSGKCGEGGLSRQSKQKQDVKVGESDISMKEDVVGLVENERIENFRHEKKMRLNDNFACDENITQRKIKGQRDTQVEEEDGEWLESTSMEELNKRRAICESTEQQTVVTESLVTESLVTESLVTESLVTESLVTESLVTESLVTESLITSSGSFNKEVSPTIITGWVYVFHVGHIDKIMKPSSML